MIQTYELSPGVTLRCYTDTRFKHGSLSLQLVRPMCREEAAMNALLPAILLRGTAKRPDLRSITMHLDDLYGATLSDMVRRVGDYQTTGFYCSFTEDRFAMPGDEILRPTVDFLREILLQPLLEDGIFSAAIVESEKKNRIADIESEFNDKRLYAANSLMRIMCPEDSFGISRMGDVAEVEAITPKGLYDHYRKLLRRAAVELFYVGSAQPEQMAALLRPLFESIDRQIEPLPAQTPFRDAGFKRVEEKSDTAQSILNLSFVTPITETHPDFVAMRVLNVILGSGMTSKLFMNVREKRSLCYSIGSNYYGTKGILTVAAGIDAHKQKTVRQEIYAQLEACKNGEITLQELDAAKEALLSALRSVYDSPSAIESFYGTKALSGMPLSIEEYRAALEAVTVEDAARVAATLQEHSAFFLKGVAQ